MRLIMTVVFSILIAAATSGFAFSQTKCVWVVKSEEGDVVQKIGVSVKLVELLGSSGGDFDINGTKVSYETLLRSVRDGSTLRIKDSTGEGETKIYGGKFGERMNEESERHNRLVVESSDSGEPTKINKLRVESVEAVGILLAMLGSKNLDEQIDKIEAALERGGVLYVRDYRKNSRLWIYVN